MIIIDSLLSSQRDPLVPNQKEGIDSSQPRLGQAPDKDATPMVEYERLDWEDCSRIQISENVLLS
jgi:hypothetical protein